MPNMSLKKVEMPMQDAFERRNNFEEVTLGYRRNGNGRSTALFKL